MSLNTSLRLLAIVAFTNGLMALPCVFAQSELNKPGQTTAAEVTEVSAESIAEIADQIDLDTELNDELKASLKQRLERTKQSLLSVEKSKKETASFAEMTKGVGDEIKSLTQKIEREKASPIASIDALTADQLATQIPDAELQLAKATSENQQLSTEPTRRQTRLSEIPAQLIEATEELASTQKQLAEGKAGNETAVETKARTLWLTARAQELKQVLERLGQERAAYAATSELLPLRQQLANQSVTLLRKKVDAMKERRTKLQREQAADTVRHTQDLVDLIPDALKSLAADNVELAKRQRKLISESAKATNNVSEIENAKEEVENELATSISRVETVGLTDALGAIFRERRDTFSNLGNQYQPDLSIGDKIAEYQTESFRLEDAIRKVDLELQELEAPAIEWKSNSVDWKSLSPPEARWVLLKKHRALMSDTLEELNSMILSIGTGDTRRRELANAIENYNDFVNRRLFWTRSAPVVSIDELRQLPAAVSWSANPAKWLSAAGAIGRSFRLRPAQSALVVLLGLALIVWRSRMRRFIAEQGVLAKHSHSTFHPTYRTLLASIVAAAVWPGVLLVLGFLLSKGADEPFSHILGSTLKSIAIFVASREVLREICRDGGLADAHLNWSAQLRSHLRFHLHWYTCLGAACLFLMLMLMGHPDSNARTLGFRWPATMLFAIIAAFHHVIFNKKSPLYSDVVRGNPKSIVYRRRNIIWGVLVLLPLSFSVLALVGYLDTVLKLGRLVQITLLWLLFVLLILALVYRWISIHRRDVARRQAKEARQRKLAALAAEGSNETGVTTGETIDEPEVADLPTLDQQTRQTAWVLAAFIAVMGLGVIWRDIMPAIEYFDELTLWRVGTGDNIEFVSLLDLMMSILVVLGLVFAARNFISLLELVILSRTSLDSGARYAMSMLLRYALFIIGAVVVFKLLSIPVQQLGWLLAAVSVGIGFGLQEIIANFVCGIILLLERPVRVGDVVTIGDTTGSVTRIQMRATTVTNWDRKELLIPNKDLITQNVLNWSLSNVINRMTLTVGVQYGVDPDRVRDLLLEVVDGHPEVMKDPAPAINLESFGDSSLNFIVRFYLANLNNRIAVTHEVNTSIAKALANASIEIPFPQRDVNLTVLSDQEPIPFQANRPDGN
ncbi:mechanosensitive ion channel domain-containing protein [Stieleria marina]